MSAALTATATGTSAEGGVARPSVARLHEQAVAGLSQVIASITADQWSLPTPCTAWDVRALVEHLVTEARWTAPLLAGLSIEEVGSSLDAPLDPDPAAAWHAARQLALGAASAALPTVVQLSAGPTPADEYLRQLTADYLIHRWDLAVALGLDDALDADLVAAVAAWFAGNAESYRGAGLIAAASTGAGADPQTRLLAEFGRGRTTEATRAAVGRFGRAFDGGDVDAVMAAMTEDCVFESTAPPDGQRHVGQAAVRQAWTEFFAASGNAVFETEEMIVSDNRAVARWRYTWAPGAEGHVRGVDVFRVENGLVAEKMSYVKG